MESPKKQTRPEYEVRLFPLAEEDGGGWAAEVPELPGCFTDGDTPEEALQNAQQAIEEWLEIARENGRPVPEPKKARDYLFSGKFTLRIPKSLHRRLAEKAEADGVSLNHYVSTLLAYNHGFESASSKLPNAPTMLIVNMLPKPILDEYTTQFVQEYDRPMVGWRYLLKWMPTRVVWSRTDDTVRGDRRKGGWMSALNR
jgi:antitoxin HicB